MVENGLLEAGYNYLVIDDCWSLKERDAEGKLVADPVKFPNGMKYMADTLHSMGLKAGIYSDVGSNTCGAMYSGESKNTNVGLYGYEEEDLWRYLVEWEFDFIKVDWCGGGQLGLNKQKSYTNISNIIQDIEYETQKDKVYNVCCWEFPGEWVVDCADSWRTGADITNTFESILYQISRVRDLAQYHGPGHVNDLDMLQIGNGMSYEEDKTHFAMWCMMSTPLMLGMDLNTISDETLSIISNAELIAINQDVACIQAAPVKNYGEVEGWTKDLEVPGSGKKAIALLNTSDEDVTVTVCFEEIGLLGVEAIRDLWAHEDISVGGTYTVTIPAHGTCVYTAKGEPVAVEEDFGNNNILTPDGSVANGTMPLSDAAAAVDLAAIGSYSWAHFTPSFTTRKGSASQIRLDYSGTAVAYNSLPTRFSWNNATVGNADGASSSGFGVNVASSKLLLSFPCDVNTRSGSAFVYVSSAEARIELIAGGKVIATEAVTASYGKTVGKEVKFSFSSDIPTDAYLRVTLVGLKSASGYIAVGAVGMELEAMENTVYSPEFYTDSNGTVISVCYAADNSVSSLSLELTEDGSSFFKTTVAASADGISAIDVGTIPALFRGTIEISLLDANGNAKATYSASVNASDVESYNVGPMTAKKLLADGAILIDVRGEGEFNRAHIDGAINIEYTEIAAKIASAVSNKSTPIVLYCSSAKRSAQALKTLLRLGYTNVYNLGSLDNYYKQPSIAFSSETCSVITRGDKIGVSFIASPYDSPEVYISAGMYSTFEDAVPLSQFVVPNVYDYYYTLKAYLVIDGVCYAETSKQFIYWSTGTIDTFAGDVKNEWISSTCGWGSMKIDKSIDGNTLSLDGTTFSKGIGTHATSEIVMNIPDGAMKFLAVVGQDDEVVKANSGLSDYYVMIFYVYIDGVLIDRTAQLGRGQSYVFDIDIPEGSQQIRLVAHEGSYSGNNYDHADWAIAGFVDYPTEG